ncbi:MAG: PIN domain-containing protein [Planctomycetota bacterium]
MILLDASVIVEFLRQRDSRIERALNELELAVCGATRAEVLHGARDEADEPARPARGRRKGTRQRTK